MIREFFQLLFSQPGKQLGRSYKSLLIWGNPSLHGVQWAQSKEKEGHTSIYPSLDSNGSFDSVSFYILFILSTCPEL